METAHCDALVFFGITGDLAYKKIFPSLQVMVTRGDLNVPVIGVAKADTPGGKNLHYGIREHAMGAGLGASHQTGWTALVAPLLDLFGRVDAKTLLESERGRVLARLIREQVGGEQTSEK